MVERCDFCDQDSVIGYGKNATERDPRVVEWHLYCAACFGQMRPNDIGLRAATAIARDFLAKATP